MPPGGDESRRAVPDCWAIEESIDRNPVNQLLVPAQTVEITADSGRAVAVGPLGSWPVYFGSDRYEGWERSLRTGRRSSDGSWLGGRDRTLPSTATASFRDSFSFRVEDADRGEPGLRKAQLGAVHAVLGYWTTKATQPATVVMPTGTGKTDTMVALLVAGMIERLLVVVPSDALRTQLAAKFETLGVLQKAGVVAASVVCPVVGRLEHALADETTANQFAAACNVIVTTPAALHASKPIVKQVLFDSCSHLFIDEAHHVGAATWKEIRESFAGKPVVQFTATPYREDGRHLGGRLIYAFPLREAQREGYFSRIRYVSVLDFTDQDRAVATRAVTQLREDLAAGLDHLLMARVRRIGRAHELLPIYEELAADLKPVTLHSTLGVRERRAALEAVDSRESRIIICVDMLGEGFDLPSLKVAAIHEPHRSLGVTLQFVGRFTRVADESIGSATVVVPRSEPHQDVNLRRLYAEDADWNVVIEDLSAAAVGNQEEISDFEEGFGTLPEEVALRNLKPRMSTVVYRTHVDAWHPEAITDLHPEEHLLTYPPPVNDRDHVAWFVTKNVEPVRWGDLRTVEETTYDLYVLYWDEEHQLLYINSSNTDSVYPELARAVGGADAHRITGENVYRVMAQVARLVPTNVGVLDFRNRSRRFSMHVGADVTEGFPTTEAQTKTKTNIFATGYEEGEKISIGASLKGRVWSYQAADTLKEWIDWCSHVGRKLIDDGISVDEVMRGFIRPVVVEERPPHVPLGLDWPWEVYANQSEDLKLSSGGALERLIDAELTLTTQTDTGPISFQVQTDRWTADYMIRFDNRNVTYEPVADEVLVTTARRSTPLSDFLTQFGLTVLFADDYTMVHPGVLLHPDRDVDPYDRDRLTSLDWTGVDIRRESQGPGRDASTVQGRVIAHVESLEAWDVLIDDDGTGEIADIVSLRIDAGELAIRFDHCKFSHASIAGSRIEDLYEVCGQAQKSVRWRRGTEAFLGNLMRRERNRQGRGRTGIIVGDLHKLYEIADAARLLRPRLTIGIAQPGLSQNQASEPQLHLLACTELYLAEAANATFEVLCSS